MEKNQLMIIIVTILMVGSLIGFGIFSGSSKPPPQQPPTTPPPETQPKEIFVVAEDVDANVQQILPSLRISALAQHFDIQNIDADVFALEKIESIQTSLFRQIPESSDFAYIADLIVDKNADLEAVAADLEGLDSLSLVNVFPRAIIAVPQTVEVTNPDLQLTKPYSFSQPFIQSLIDLKTRAGDEIKVSMQLTLRGEALVQAQIFETANVTSADQSHSIELQAAISSLNESLVFSNEIAYSGFSVEEMVNNFEGVSGIEETRIELLPANERIDFKVAFNVFDENTSLIKEDLNSFALSLSGVNDFIYALTPGTFAATIVLEDFDSFAGAKNALIEKINSSYNVLGEITIENPEALLFGELTLTSKDSSKTSKNARQILESFGVETRIDQSGSITLESIEDNNSVFFFEEPQISALFLSGHAEGDLVKMELNFVSSRDKVVFAQAVELEE